MTLAQAKDHRRWMLPVQGYPQTLAYCEDALMAHIEKIYKEFEEDRPSKRRTRTNMVTSGTEIPSFRSFMDVMAYLKTNTKNIKGNPLTFDFEGEEVKISLKGKAYYSKRDNTPDLSFEDNGRFCKLLYNYKHLLQDAMNEV